MAILAAPMDQSLGPESDDDILVLYYLSNVKQGTIHLVVYKCRGRGRGQSQGHSRGA